MTMNPTVSAVLRSTLISLGALWICLYFHGVWDETATAFFVARSWVAVHFLLLLGATFAVVGLLWAKGRDWLTWIRGFFGSPESTFGKVILALAVLSIAIGTLALHTIGPICAFVLIWIGTFALFQAPAKTSEPCPDYYHRKHLVERLAELLLETPENIRRIGILAEWGEGKTQVMKLLEEHLSGRTDHKFRMAWVNPWRASSREDAWVEIAKGVDEALGFPRLLPQSILSLPGIGSLLELLPNPISGFTSDLKTLLTSDGSAADKIAVGLTEFLRRRNQWLLIFVDDMERVGPKDLRKIFPVVDRLIELERCYFIFAIDPKRIAKAFKEGSAHADETKGYLDKILDLQMTLPVAAQGEVLEMLQNKIDRLACPKLTAVLPKLRDHLPLNPRLADRFLRDADGRERMFLSRFGPDEENYEGFFLLVLLEVRFPEAFKKITHDRDFFENLKMADLFGREEGETKFDELVTAITKDFPTRERYDLKNLLKRLHTLTSVFLRYDHGEKSLDLEWAIDGYRKLIRFTFAEREQFIAEWTRTAGEKPLQKMLQTVGDFSEPDLVIRQALELQLEEIRQWFSDAYRLHYEGLSLAEISDKISKSLKRFTRHAAAIRDGKLEKLDEQVFGRELFDAWMKVVEHSPLRDDLPIDFIETTLEARKATTAALLRLLTPQEAYDLALIGLKTLAGSAPSEQTEKQLREEFRPLEVELIAEFSTQFQNLLREKPIPSFYPPHWMRGASQHDLRDAYSWLPNDAEKAKEILLKLVAEAHSNENLRDNFVWLVRRELLNAFRLPPHDGYREQDAARRAITAFPWYLKHCWDGAWSNPPIPGIAKDLVRLRERALTTEEAGPPEKSIASILHQLPVPHEYQANPESPE
jgi:hypothetical protein